MKGSKTPGAILSLLKEETTEEAVITAMRACLDAAEEVIVRDVKKVRTELGRNGVLYE